MRSICVEEFAYRICGSMMQALVQYARQNVAREDVADAQHERHIADDLPDTPGSPALIDTLDGKEANVRGEDNGSLYQYNGSAASSG